MKECPKCFFCFNDEQNQCPHDDHTLFVSNHCTTALDKRYIIEKRLGKGGMGAVYKAKHVHLKSIHAIKIISPEVVKSDPTLMVRFTQEAVLAASIHHPNVINVTDFGVENTSTPFLVMEYIDGISLDQFLRREKKLAPAAAFEIFKPIALGVGAAHGKGITHRDIKPLNVMLRDGLPFAQAVKVLDFGLAKIKSTEFFSSLVMAKTSSLLGSPHYMPPEQWDNENVDTRSDIYSLGIILFQMLVGEVPFRGNSLPNIMFQHLQVPVPSFASLGTGAAPKIEAVIQKALAKEQDNRFATVEEFLAAFEDALPSVNQSGGISTEKTLSFSDRKFPSFENGLDRATTRGDLPENNFPYLDSGQNKTLSNFFNQTKTSADNKSAKLETDFLSAQNRVAQAYTKIDEAERLALEFSQAQKIAEDARQKLLEAQKKIEEDVRRQIQAEMEDKLAAETEARRKAEAEAERLKQETEKRKAAEERANALARTALEAQQRAEDEQRKAEKAMRRQQLEEGTRRQAEESAARLAQEAAEAKNNYETAKREAENEAYFRMEAEVKRRKIEEEIERLTLYEAEKRQIAEAEAARQIKAQASRLEKQVTEAEEKAEQARRLAEKEAQRREEAETARTKAELEARRLAEEIIEAQKKLEEAEQFAQSESRKREKEEEARKKAENSARSLAEKIKQDEARTAGETGEEKNFFETANQKFAADSESDLRQRLPVSTFDRIAPETISSTVSNTGEIPRRRKNQLAALAGGIFIFAAATFFAGYFIYRSNGENLSGGSNNSSNVNAEIVAAETKKVILPTLPARISDKMVLLKGGAFQMGRNDADPNDKRIYSIQYPAHPAAVEDFYLDRTEVTNEEYAQFVKATGSKAPDGWTKGNPPSGEERFPVTNVSYFDARNFADWISARDNMPCRLPTEREWEYAARSGERQNIYPWGSEWSPERVNFATGTVRAVGAGADETEIGKIEDMMGNVLEWTSSTLEYYPGFPENLKVKADEQITVRGVSFTKEMNAVETLQKTDLLLTLRQGVSPNRKYKFLGFRLVCNAK